jgi:hypothetical protein
MALKIGHVKIEKIGRFLIQNLNFRGGNKK